MKRRLLIPALLAAACLHLVPAHAAPAVGTDNAEAIKENKRVAIERFCVEFYTQLYGEGRSGRNTARVSAELQGISDATRQAITQQAYSETVAALQNAGFEVVDVAELAAQPLFKALDEKYGKPSPYVVEDEKLLAGGRQISRIVAPEGMKAYFQSGTARGDFSQRVEAQNQGIGAQQGELAKALNATLLQVHVLASFGSISGTKNGALRLFAGLAARAAIEAQPLLYPEETQIQIVNSGGARTFGMSRRMGHSGAVYLKEPLVAADNIFEMHDTHAVTARSEDAYRSTYQALIHDALQALVASLAAAR